MQVLAKPDGVHKRWPLGAEHGSYHEKIYSEPEGIKVLPVNDVLRVMTKNAGRGDLLNSHRVQPQMVGIIPEWNGGFGNVVKAV